ncbi:hypothetical protein IQ266_24780 [filamentous cyanobacterium LEGE 11480]|uniref:Uncharacterized protein n=1 Tax=Romeriopsis navalis LEGE 11480 TaxID=2777977 RepID=A0A928Z4T3_9CYAN|nr:hypothetical protein [Romeriopsis navalis]MBE9032956.1 hypothetical protein [Romeriopsis navalis LEGE 11480]
MKLYLLPLLLTLTLLPTAAFGQEAPPIPSSAETPAPRRLNSPSGGLTPMDGTKQVQLQLVNCNNFVDCGLAKLLLPQATFIQSRQLQFANQGQIPIPLLNTTVVAEGKLTGYQISPEAININSTQTFAANQISSLPLNIDRTKLPPDQYSGTVHLVLDKQPKEWLTLPINVSVRSGPLLPLVVLIWGILLGRLLKYMQERGEPQAKVLQELNELEYELRSLDPADQSILIKAVAQARRAGYREQFDVAEAKIKMIRDRLDVLTNLRTLENQLEKRVEPIPDETVNAAIDTVQSTRNALVKGENKQVGAGIEQVEQLLNTAAVGRGTAPSQTQNLLKGVTESFETLTDQSNTIITADQQSFLNWFQRSLMIASGVSDRAKAEATFWVVRPLLALVLLAGLSAVGLGSLYVDKGSTFGARPFSDYLGLILWGLSADVASRSLSSLSGKKAE